MSVILSKEFIQRLIKDVKYLKQNPLVSNGIHYLHDEDNLMIGYALIIGPKNTVYENGFYFFKFNFTPNYPHEPPKVKFITNGQHVRFNPNLYTDGKVCISILNTWTGEQWSSCQTISSILLTLCSLFNENPLLNEPNIDNDTPDIPFYNTLLKHANINIAICDIINESSHLHKNSQSSFISLFRNIYLEHFLNNYQDILNQLHNMIKNCKHKSKKDNIRISIYDYYNTISYLPLLKKLETTYISVSS